MLKHILCHNTYFTVQWNIMLLIQNTEIVGYFEPNVATAKQNRKCALAGNWSHIMKPLPKRLKA